MKEQTNRDPCTCTAESTCSVCITWYTSGNTRRKSPEVAKHEHARDSQQIRRDQTLQRWIETYGLAIPCSVCHVALDANAIPPRYRIGYMKYGSIFCSDKCRKARKHRLASTRDTAAYALRRAVLKEQPSIACGWCHRDIPTTDIPIELRGPYVSSGSLFCGKRCKDHHRASAQSLRLKEQGLQKWVETFGESVPCAICGTAISMRGMVPSARGKYRQKQRVYCSQDCRRIGKAEYQRRYHALRGREYSTEPPMDHPGGDT
jgi:hypothetical protein